MPLCPAVVTTCNSSVLTNCHQGRSQSCANRTAVLQLMTAESVRSAHLLKGVAVDSGQARDPRHPAFTDLGSSSAADLDGAGRVMNSLDLNRDIKEHLPATGARLEACQPTCHPDIGCQNSLRKGWKEINLHPANRSTSGIYARRLSSQLCRKTSFSPVTKADCVLMCPKRSDWEETHSFVKSSTAFTPVRTGLVSQCCGLIVRHMKLALLIFSVSRSNV